jgi:hypothetical protein
VTLGDRETAGRSPAAVPVHDDRDAPRCRSRLVGQIRPP